MATPYRDWIPDDEAAAPEGKGFVDYIPPAAPEVKTEVAVEAESETFKCQVCGFETKTKIALMGHSRKHK